MNVTQLAIGIPLTLALVGCTTVKHERSSGKYVKLDYPASAASNELQIAVTYTMWIPDGVKTLRGIIVHQHGAGTTASIEGSTAALSASRLTRAPVTSVVTVVISRSCFSMLVSPCGCQTRGARTRS